MKAFILAAGFGTRNLPITKTIPKELFPIYNRTVIDFILDECAEAGINDIIILTNKRKKALEDYFDRDYELEKLLNDNGKIKEINQIKKPCKFNVSFIRQQEMKGTGHALLTAKSLLKDEAFVAFFPDDIVLNKIGGTKQLLDLYNQQQKCILGARKEFHNISNYGVIEYKEQNGLNYVTRIVEKPKKNEVNSNLVSIGRFIYTPEFLEILEKEYQNHISGEFYPMSSMMRLARKEGLLVHIMEGKVLDIGNHDSYLATILEYADRTEEGRIIIDQFIQNRK